MGNTAGPRHYFMAVACLSGQRSKDPVTQGWLLALWTSTGALWQLATTACQRGCHDDLLPWGKSKDPTLHGFQAFVRVPRAEMNAIVNKKLSHSCTIYVALFPCNECAKLIIQSGIKEVVYLSDKHRTKPATKAAKRMLAKAGVSMWQSAVDFKKSLLRLAESLDCPVAGQELRLMTTSCTSTPFFCTGARFAKVRRKFRRAIIDNGNDDEQRRLRDFVRSLIDAKSTPEPRAAAVPGRSSCCATVAVGLMEVQPAADRCARLLLPYLAMGHLVRLYTVLLAVLARCRVPGLGQRRLYASLRRRLREFPPSDGAACAAARRLGKRCRRESTIPETLTKEAAAEASALVTAPAEADEADNPVEESAGPAWCQLEEERSAGHRRAADLLLRAFFLRPQPTMTIPRQNKSSKKRKKKQKQLDSLSEVAAEHEEMPDVDAEPARPKKAKKNKKKRSKSAGNLYIRGLMPSVAPD
uniref:dCMP deaminase n=1 Tax=Macrostomum lignano TaxID=282301 RepID=A0A1I8F975_9PLAT